MLLLWACATKDAPRNVVLVSMDTLRADRLGAYGHPGGLTPNLDRFAGEATLFENAYSQATLTAPSHASMFSSRYPSEFTGPGRQPVFSADMPLLAEVMKVYGFQTGAFVGGGDLNPHMGMTAGFETYISPRDFGCLYHTVPPALDWIDNRDASRPFFAFVHGYDSHSRYLKPAPFGFAIADSSWDGPGRIAVEGPTERVFDGYLHPAIDAWLAVNQLLLRPRSPAGRAKFKEMFMTMKPEPLPLGPQDEQLIRDVYDGAVVYGDAWFGLLMAGLEERDLLDDTLIVLMSDHGEQMGESGVFNHSAGVDDVETHVPLLVRAPGGGEGRRVADYVGLLDVAPTIVEYVGGQPPAAAQGLSLMPALRGEAFAGRDAVYTMGNDRMRSVTARSAAGRLTYTGIFAPSALLPDLVAVARIDGPGFERTAGMDDEAAGKLRAEMVAWLGALATSPSTTTNELPASLRAELRAHGYWDVEE